jgi:hypothetical protein
VLTSPAPRWNRLFQGHGPPNVAQFLLGALAELLLVSCSKLWRYCCPRNWSRCKKQMMARAQLIASLWLQKISAEEQSAN